MTEALQSPRAGRGVSLLGTNAKLRAAGEWPCGSGASPSRRWRGTSSRKPARRCACGPESRGLRGGGLEVRKARHGPLQRPANLRQRLELPHLCCQDHGTAAAGSSRRDQPASAGGRRSPAPDPDHPHGRGDDLGQLIQRQAKALRRSSAISPSGPSWPKWASWAESGPSR